MRSGSSIRDLSGPGSGMEKYGSGIRNNHAGSATLNWSPANGCEFDNGVKLVFWGTRRAKLVNWSS
jgi:hypothetical protein